MAGEGREDTFSFNRQIVRRAVPEAETSVVEVCIWVQVRLATQRKNLPNTHNRRHQIAAEWIFPTMVIKIQQQDARRVATATTIAPCAEKDRKRHGTASTSHGRENKVGFANKHYRRPQTDLRSTSSNLRVETIMRTSSVFIWEREATCCAV